MDQFTDLDQIGRAVDRLDRDIVSLLAERAGCVERAAGFKPAKSQVVDTDRTEDVIRKVRHHANENGVDPDLIEHVYRALLDAYLIHEAQAWRRLHEGRGPEGGGQTQTE